MTMSSLRWEQGGARPPARRSALVGLALLVAALAVAAIGCSGSDGASSSAPGSVAASNSSASPSADVTPPTDAVAASTTTTVAATTVPPTAAAPATTIAPTTTVPPDALQLQPGVAAIQVTATGADPTRPTFTWAAVAGASSYELVVHAGDGSPSWAWTGIETTVPLGGVERATDQEGPTLTGPSTVRVYAFDASTHLVGISPWTPLTP